MHAGSESRKTRKRSGWLAFAVLALGLSATLLAYRAFHQVERQQADTRAEVRAREVAGYLVQRFRGYEQMLRAGAALFDTEPRVTRNQWHQYVERMQIDRSYPGTQGVGYAAWLAPEAVAAFEAGVRAEGFPDFSVIPSGVRAEYSSILYLEPFDARNRRAFGYDMYSQATRREAMARARDTGEPALTGKVVLLQETDVNRQSGVLLYLPVYRGAGIPATEAERRARLRGFVYSPLRMADLIDGVLQDSFKDVAVRIYDEVDGDPQRLLFRSQVLSERSMLGAGSEIRMPVAFAGRSWALQVLPVRDATAMALSGSSLMLVAGGVVSALLSLLVWGLASGRERAQVLAERMTGAYRDAQRTQKAILDSVADGVLSVDAEGRILSSNPAAERMFGAHSGQLSQLNIRQLLPSHDHVVRAIDRQGGATRTELQASSVTGRHFPVELSVNPLSGAETGSVLVESIRDIGERRRAEALLARTSGLRDAILRHAPFAIISADADGRISGINPAASDLLGYDSGELVERSSLSVFVELSGDATGFADSGEIDGETDLDTVLRCVRGGAVDEREVTYVRKDGSRVLVNQVLTALRDSTLELIGYLAIAYDITERKRSEEYIRHLAHHDALTELPNRTMFRDRLDSAIALARRSGRRVGVLMVDLDHFKRINDSLGHLIGDQVLVQLTARFRSCVREIDTVARMGGDEFVIVLPEIPDSDDVLQAARTLVDVVAKPVQVGRHELHLTPSVGVCFYPEDGGDSMTLLKNADTAMYDAKSRGRNRYSVFSPDMLRVSEEKMQLENSLRRALSEKKLQMFFQPQINIATGRVDGMEALLRWPTENGDFVPPDVFIPIAEDTGLIAQIGEELLLEACEQALALGTELGRPIKLAVNVSPQQFHHQNLAAMIGGLLERSGLPPERLTVEITERVLVRDPTEAAATLRALRDLGVGVAIDDFGTGYSSLSYISQFPISTLKIDRSFVRDLSSDTADAAVINAVIAMGHSLGLTVVAEGVETALQLEYLKSRGCDQAQGFHFGRGVPQDEFVDMVRRIEGPADATAGARDGDTAAGETRHLH